MPMDLPWLHAQPVSGNKTLGIIPFSEIEYTPYLENERLNKKIVGAIKFSMMASL